MKRKNNWNLLGVIVLIAMCAFILISCQQGPTLKPYKTLTLDIDGQQQKLYYGDDKAWYNALSEGGLLIDDNKVTGDNVKFNISETTNKWTVTFKKNIPNGASESDFTIRPASVDVTSELSLSPDNVIDITTGKVIPSSISEDVTIIGKYPPTAIGKSVTASSTNPNYEFEKWTANGEDIADITTYKVSGNTEIVANWKNLSDLKVLTVKDGDVVKDTVYYNLTDSKWYADENMTGERTSVIPPEVQEKTYTITIDSENDTPDDIRTVTSSFLGYGVGSEVKVQAGGSLSGYRINEDTELVFLWSEEKITEPSQQPTKDSFVFNGWYNGEKTYDFNSVVTGNIIITAHWTKKTFNTLTLDIAGQEQKLYYGSDSAWYKAVVGEEELLLVDNRVTGDNVKFNIPSAPKWTVTFNKNTPAGANDSEISISHESVVLTPELSLSPNNVIDKTTGKVLPGSISGHVTVTGTYPSKAIVESVIASSTNSNYQFAGWTVKGVTIDNLADYEVSGNTEIVANWKNISEFKILTVKDGESVKDTAYYNTTSNKWYKERSITSEVKTSVVLPSNTTKIYTITLKYNNGSEAVTSTLNSTFSGYGLSGADSVNIPVSGELANYTIENDTVLVSKWSEAKITKPENPTRDGYVFDKWTSNDTEYNFDNAVTEDITLVAVWTQKTFNTLTLNIGGQEQKLYYGSDSAWYSDVVVVGEDQLLLDRNKITGDVKFIIPSAPTWTVTFDKNVPDGASESEFTITRESVVLKPELSLSPGDLIDNTGKVIPISISENKTVTGTYPSKVIVESVIASSTNVNYEFAGWTVNGETINIATYEVNGNITIKATWNNISNFKTLTVKDGDVVKDTAYYNATDKKWYVSNDITSKLKTSVPTLPNREYTITLNYDNNGLNETRSEKVTSSFLGYGTNDNTSAVIGTNGSLNGYTIDKDTELISKWNEVKFTKPENPTRDGYVFNSWYNGDDEYSFDSVVTESMTLTAHWTKKTFNTLTLNIAGQEQTLYYGSDNAWYSDVVGEEQLLIDDNKITGDEVKFNIPSAPTWTVTFDKNIPDGASESEFTVSANTKTVTPDLTLTPDNTVDASSGKVKVENISEDTIVTGEYLATAIGESVTASSTNANYEFEKWTANGEDITDTTNYKVNGDTEIVANWKNVSSFKVLTVKDGGVVKDTAYYNTKDRKWYVSNDITSGEKTTVPTLPNREYTLTLNYDNNGLNEIRSEKVTSSFLGYGTDDNTSAVIGTNGLLSDYTIDKDTELVSLWSKEKFNKPSDPTRDGYVFEAWYNGEKLYIFDSVVTENITITAHWTKKTFNTLTLDIEGQKEQKLYYGSDNAWYSDVVGEEQLLIDDNKVTGDVKFNIPSAPTWNVTFNKNTPAGAIDSEILISRESVVLTPELSLSPDDLIENTGKVRPNSISENVIITGTYPPTAIGQDVTASSTNSNYKFEKWTVKGVTIDNLLTHKVNGDTEIVANWNNMSSFKTLTVKDGGVVKDTAWFNVTDGKWYVSNNTTSGEKTSVDPPEEQEKTYTLTLDYDNDGRNETRSEPVTSSFRGYGLDGNTNPVIEPDGLLKDYTIENDTVLVSLWSKEKFNKPSDPTRDGYVFNGWYNGENPYNFDNVVEGNMTLTAHWIKKTFNTLTLNITGSDAQTLYYGSDNAWYTAVSENDLLLDANKVTGEDVKFNIPSAPVWTVTFDKNIPSGADESDFTITPASVDVTPDLTLTPGDLIDNAGKVIPSSISENKTVIGTYPLTAIGQDKDIKPSTTNVNYEFAGWTVNDVTIDNIANYAVSGNITIKATWKNISSFKVLTVKDGDVVKDTAYYNLTDKKWYVDEKMTGEKPSVLTLPNIEYTITFNTDGGSTVEPVKATSSFRGYGDGREVKVHEDGLLSAYTIDQDTELVSLWSDAKFNEPSDKPTKDGYVFEAWYNGENPYSFDNVVTGNMTLTAHWKEKPKKLTVKDGVNEIDTAWFYTIDKKWYENENMTDEKTSVDIPQDRTYTLTLDYANDSPNGNGGSVTSSFRGYGVGSEVKVPSNGSLSGCTISDTTVLVSLWSEAKFNKPSDPTKDGYVFEAWYNGDDTYSFDSVVTGDITITAHWTKKTFNTLTLNIEGQKEQTLHYGSDNAWYSDVVVKGEDQLLIDENKVTGDVKFNIPSAPVWTLTLNKNRSQNAPFSDADIILSKNQLTLYPKDGVFSSDQYISKDGIVKVPSITDNVNVTLDTSRRYPSENVEATISRDDIKFLGWKIGDEKITDLSTYEVTADNITLNASWGYKASIGALDSPNNGVHNADRGFYTEREEIDDYVKDKSKQKRVAYYAKGERVRLFYNESMMHGLVRINLKNEWSGETKQITPPDSYYNEYVLVNIDMPNQPLSISFEVIAGGEPA